MSYETFEVGEVAIYHRPGNPNHGKEVTILSPLKLIKVRDTWSGQSFEDMAYEIEMPGAVFGPFAGTSPNTPSVGRPIYLRKKRPPRDDLQLVKWSECPWQPTKVST